MENTFYTWNDFVGNFGKEMALAAEVYERMRNAGLKDFTYSKFDYHFVSEKKSNLIKLNKFLTEHYSYTFQEYTKFDRFYELRGVTIDIPITEDILMYWALDMAKRGLEFDCKLDGYGSSPDTQNPVFPKFSKIEEDVYFNKGIELYDNGNLSGAIINWTIVLAINSKDPNAYYSRAIVKNELYMWKSAIQDYNKAIEMAPDFTEAIVNRGTVKDENGDYEGAIVDYNLALSIDPSYAMAYFNRGNTKFNISDKKGACEDWKKALEFGDESAKERINANCK